MIPFAKKRNLSLLFFLALFSFCNEKGNAGSASAQDVNTTTAENFGIPQNIASTDTSAGWKQAGQKILITGIIYKSDARTPAPGVVLYYYHTNTGGKYLHKENEKRSLPPNSEGQTHGYIRGWVKTDSAGKYSIYTVRPGVYPTRDEPAHIHLTIKEPGLEKSYYVDEVVFDDDKLLTTERRKKMENRGGSGIVRMLQKDSVQIAEHNIILGLNIPGYAKSNETEIKSGLSIGEDQPSFIPFHASGPDKGTSTCPVCKYGRYQGILYFVGNKPDWEEIKKWLSFLERESIARGKYLKVYFVYGNEKGYNKDARMKEIGKTGAELNLENIALTFVASFADTETEVHLNKINPDVENTFVVYRFRTIVEKYISLQPTKDNFKMLSSILDKTKGDYFDLSAPE